MALSLVTAPDASSAAVTLEAAKTQCALTGITEFDSFLSDQVIPAAIDRAQGETQRQILRAVWAWHLDAFPCAAWIEVPKPPLAKVLSVTYVDEAGVTQTWAPDQYLVDAPAGPRARRGRLAPAYGVSWPLTRPQMSAVTIEFLAGYGADADAVVTTPDDVPALLRQALLIDIATLFEHREQVVTGTIATEIPRSSRDVYRLFRSR